MHVQFSSVQMLSRVWLFATPMTAVHQASLSIINSLSLLNSFPSSQWYYPTISSSIVLFSSCPQSFPASGSFPMRQSVQGTLKSLLQHHSSKVSILQCSAFFIVHLSHPYMTTGKTIAWLDGPFVGKVMSLFFNMLSRLVTAFIPRSKCLLISWLQSPSAVTLEPTKIKSFTVSFISPSICHEVMGPDAIIFIFWMLSFSPAFSLSS